GSLEKGLPIHRLAGVLGIGFVDRPVDLLSPLPQRELGLDDLEGEEVVTLLLEDETETGEILSAELAIPGRGSIRVDQALALEEPDLGDGDVRELVSQEVDRLPDAQLPFVSHRQGQRCRGSARSGPRRPRAGWPGRPSPR